VQSISAGVYLFLLCLFLLCFYHIISQPSVTFQFSSCYFLPLLFYSRSCHFTAAITFERLPDFSRPANVPSIPNPLFFDPFHFAKLLSSRREQTLHQQNHFILPLPLSLSLPSFSGHCRVTAAPPPDSNSSQHTGGALHTLLMAPRIFLLHHPFSFLPAFSFHCLTALFLSQPAPFHRCLHLPISSFPNLPIGPVRRERTFRHTPLFLPPSPHFFRACLSNNCGSHRPVSRSPSTFSNIYFPKLFGNISGVQTGKWPKRYCS
jgi:hypothetical protein